MRALTLLVGKAPAMSSSATVFSSHGPSIDNVAMRVAPNISWEAAPVHTLLRASEGIPSFAPHGPTPK